MALATVFIMFGMLTSVTYMFYYMGEPLKEHIAIRWAAVSVVLIIITIIMGLF